MSRIGKKQIIIPEGVKVEIKDDLVLVSGPKATLEFKLRPEVVVKIDDGKIKVTAKVAKTGGALQGTTRQIIANMIVGVTDGWSKKLEVVGTGYRVVDDNGKLTFSLGFSHKIDVKSPEGITLSAAENKVTVSGADKVLVGKTAAEIRALRPPDAYKGKGVRYLGEIVRLKPGKATKVGASGGK
ncbi:MAG: 50S ribosomal protein L6 [bacterium]|nr:50S ribosomal protein L6 [bacterium]